MAGSTHLERFLTELENVLPIFPSGKNVVNSSSMSHQKFPKARLISVATNASLRDEKLFSLRHLNFVCYDFAQFLKEPEKLLSR